MSASISANMSNDVSSTVPLTKHSLRAFAVDWYQALDRRDDLAAVQTKLVPDGLEMVFPPDHDARARRVRRVVPNSDQQVLRRSARAATARWSVATSSRPSIRIPVRLTCSDHADEDRFLRVQRDDRCEDPLPSGDPMSTRAIIDAQIIYLGTTDLMKESSRG